ncbi:hypothetical protein ACQP1K_17430 [Sphaerimonospora sp. CA-214678]|uniref:hypothetical protein n=1 Tax=Sphaerimonospora sp. CA-214678 TaxID=3240029 RepID=UPI003D91FF97
MFRLLVQERHWDNWVVFCGHFEEAARALAKETNTPRLASVTVARRTFDRWFAGDWYGRPHNDAARVLEHLLGFPRTELFAPAPDVLEARKAVHDRGGLQASIAIGQRWPTSRLFLSAADDVADSWELTGRKVLDGTTSAVHFLPAVRRDDEVGLRHLDPAALVKFLRQARRGLLVGVEEQDDDLRLYVIDSVNARKNLAASTSQAEGLALTAGHELDDLTYGILWSLVQLDDGLLADDQALDEEQQVLEAYLQLPRSAPSRMTLPMLTSVGARWLGSAFCAQHIQRRLDGASEAPLFWTREQTGEEAAAWLFFRHKIAYLQALRRQFGGAASPLSRTFCIPEAEVARTDRYERVLLFLAVALMEMYGIRVQVTARPEYSAVDGFVLVPGQRAIVANWVRTEALWMADTTTGRADLRSYHEAVSEAADQSLLQGNDPETRLRAMAGYLGLDWRWVTRRSCDVGECGVANLVRPRSRLISVDVLDEVLRFVGSLAPDQ